jgi:group II intron reverse transcriptase/maturase
MYKVPTVTDRLLQQAVLQVINARFEYEFSDSSFGSRPNKNVQQAVLKAQGYINEGFQYIVDIDLKTFFDEVDHCYLLQLVYRKIKCRETLRLIRKWLRSPIQIKGKLVKRRKGVPQGSPLSPLLSNIMLHELDRELERQGLRFVRYVDDFSIYVKTKATARKVGNNIYKFLKKKLKLSINRERADCKENVRWTFLRRSQVEGWKHPPTCTLYLFRVWVCAYLCKRRTWQISTGSMRKELGKAKAKAQNPHPENHANEF